jgi:hypothetical protein
MAMHKVRLTPAILLFACLAFTACYGAAYGQGAPRNPTPEEVLELFERLTKPVPPRLLLVAELEILKPSWTEEQVQRELANQERIMAANDRNLVPADKEMLRQGRLKAIRSSNSGRKQMKVREWLSGALYRLDQTDLSILEVDDTLAYKITNNIISYHMTFVNINDPAFTNMTAFYANHSIESATIGTSRQQRLELWQALTVEPNFAMAFLILLVDTNSIAAAATNQVDTSFAGWRMDSRKLDALVKQEIPHWSFTVREIPIEGNLVKCLVMEGIPNGPKAGFKLAFYSDAANPSRLLRIEAESKTPPTHYISIREDFDGNGFPRFWHTDSMDEKGVRMSRTVRFTEADINPVFEDRDVFLPRFPTNYIVAAITPSGSQIVQHPNPNFRILDERATSRIKPTLIVIIAVLLLAPLILLRRKLP